MTKPKTDAEDSEDAEDAAWREGHAQGVAEQTALTVQMRQERDDARVAHCRVQQDGDSYHYACQVYGTTWALTVRDRL